ncbi:MAG: biotin--[acetyl-CoA-carboxylase] ligase [Verrucomicrobiae bacterium]|nr:biotin--[acetyl-CoA-carboxylase] ligase [Verrucomicrobiae bacterium]
MLRTTKGVLACLEEAQGGFIPAQDLCEKTRISARQLADELTVLRRLGHAIEADPTLGYRLARPQVDFDVQQLRQRLASCCIGREIIALPSTTSTNDVAFQLSQNGRSEGVVVFAETQSAGRGRLGRAWVSPNGRGLWFSVLLRPRMPTARLTVAAAVALTRVVAGQARIKWPNDIVVNDRKLAGILTEARGEIVVLGIGLNVYADAPWPAQAISLEELLGERPDRTELAARVLMELDRCYSQAAQDFDGLLEEWATRCVTLGKQIELQIGGRRLVGLAYALDENGALIVRRDNGQTERVYGADVTLVHG